jgi:hypothetical protein
MEGIVPEGRVHPWLRCYRCWSQNLQATVYHEEVHKIDSAVERSEAIEERQEAEIQCLDCKHEQPHLKFEDGRLEPVEDRWERMIMGTPWVATCTVTLEAGEQEADDDDEEKDEEEFYPELAEEDEISLDTFGDAGVEEFFIHVRFTEHKDEQAIAHLIVEFYARSLEEATDVLESAAQGALTITALVEESRPPASTNLAS